MRTELREYIENRLKEDENGRAAYHEPVRLVYGRQVTILRSWQAVLTRLTRAQRNIELCPHKKPPASRVDAYYRTGETFTYPLIAGLREGGGIPIGCGRSSPSLPV